jgi:uncharacterized protein
MPERSRNLAVITGASSGIGAEFARQLARRGYDLLLAARREDRLEALANEIRNASSAEVDFVAVDLATDAGRALVADRVRKSPKLALLVNNAGFGTNGFFTEVDLASQEQMHQLHVLTTMALTHAALENWSKRESLPAAIGIINVASVASFGQSPSNVSYCATKAWMASFTNGLATELAMRGSPIRLQALCPGFTYSEFHDVLKMNRSLVPKSLWLKTDFVVSESLAGFDRGALYVIPGWRYKILVRLIKIMPESLLRWFSIQIAHRRRKARMASTPA